MSVIDRAQTQILYPQQTLIQIKQVREIQNTQFFS